MLYSTFEYILSPPRLQRYLDAVAGNSRRARTLYRKNILLSQELFAVIGRFEVTLRNKIDRHYTFVYGDDWIQNSTERFFFADKCLSTRKKIQEKRNALGTEYTHDKLIAEMEWVLAVSVRTSSVLRHWINIAKDFSW